MNSHPHAKVQEKLNSKRNPTLIRKTPLTRQSLVIQAIKRSIHQVPINVTTNFTNSSKEQMYVNGELIYNTHHYKLNSDHLSKTTVYDYRAETQVCFPTEKVNNIVNKQNRTMSATIASNSKSPIIVFVSPVNLNML